MIARVSALARAEKTRSEVCARVRVECDQALRPRTHTRAETDVLACVREQRRRAHNKNCGERAHNGNTERETESIQRLLVREGTLAGAIAGGYLCAAKILNFVFQISRTFARY